MLHTTSASRQRNRMADAQIVRRKQKMSKHQDILPHLVEKIAEADPNYGIVLQGSVADCCEKPDSDLDLFVVCGSASPRFNEFIQSDNRGNMRAKGPVEGIKIDIGWEEVEFLVSSIEQDGAAGWYMFSQGKIIHDPAGLAKRCHDIMNRWLGHNPIIAKTWAEQHAEVRKKKMDSSYELRFPTFADFYKHVRELQRLNDTEPSAPANADKPRC
ncbi:hypothetical protein ACFL1X_07035 [Candidatus Hydrogenedentota bacterium]